FFQAEDGIRDRNVTGVQTCALPILKFSLGWQNCMPAFTTIINNVYLILVPVGILIGSRADDFAGFAMTFIFYLLFVPAISGVLRSEERRVGKEWGAQWWRARYKTEG